MSFLKRHRVAMFFVLAYVLAWGVGAVKIERLS